MGQSRKSGPVDTISGPPPKPDVVAVMARVSFGPFAGITGLPPY
jgi:hypothetical protein